MTGRWLGVFYLAFAILTMSVTPFLAPRTPQDVQDTGKPTVPHYLYRTATPVPAGPPERVSEIAANFLQSYPTPTPTPTPEPKPAPGYASVHAAGSWPWSNDPTCLAHPERYEWKKWSVAAGFPPEVVESVEMATLIRKESGGDLCAVNRSSGATCWFQQVKGGPQYLDPATCASIGYAKWLDGGGSFERHWYRFWN